MVQLLRTEGLNLEYTLDRDGRVSSFDLDRRGSDEWLIRVFQEGVLKETIDTSVESLGIRSFLSSLDTLNPLDRLQLQVGRITPRPRPPGSVGAGSQDGSGTNTGTSVSTASFTPSNSEFVISVIQADNAGDVGTVTSITDTFADTITYTAGPTVTVGNPRLRCTIYYGTGWSSGAGVVTANFSDSELRSVISVDTFAGVHTTTPESENNNGTSTAATLSISLVGVAANNRSFGAVGSRQDDDGISPGASFTELLDLDDPGGGNRCRLHTQYATSVGGATPVDWSALNTLGNAGLAVELAEAGGGGPAGFAHSQGVIIG